MARLIVTNSNPNGKIIKIVFNNFLFLFICVNVYLSINKYILTTKESWLVITAVHWTGLNIMRVISGVSSYQTATVYEG